MNDRVSTTPRDGPPSVAHETCVVTAGGAEQSSPPARSLRRTLKRIGLTALAVVALFAALGATAYGFGSMEIPSAEMRAQYDALVASGKVAAVKPAGFHIPIPGCRCHSSDPVVTIEHEGYRIRDCASCHSRGGAGARQ